MAIRVFMFSEYQLQHPEMKEVLKPLLFAATDGTLRSDFGHLLTVENLSFKLYVKTDDPYDPRWTVWDTIIGKAAEHRHLDQIPSEVVGALVTEVVDEEGTTVLHAAARSGCLDQVPACVLTPENLLGLFDSAGWSAAAAAGNAGFFRHLPSSLKKAEVLGKGDSGGWTFFHTAAKRGFLDKLPKRILTARTMSLATRYDGTTPLHLAARSGHLDRIPTRALTLQALKMRDYQGNTPLHYAVATFCRLQRVPRCVPCEDALLQVNGENDTVLHMVWRDGDPASIDPGIYTPEVLNWAGRGGKTVLDYAEEKEALKLIPKERIEAGRALRDKLEQEREEAELERLDRDPTFVRPAPPDTESAEGIIF
jgi:hypothetical protein